MAPVKILIKKARIVDPQSSWHNQVVDLLLENGEIAGIDSIIKADAEIFEAENLHVSRGWIDLYSQIGDPGFEHRETVDSALESAAAGGFTLIAVSPLAKPVTDNKGAVQYLQNRSLQGPCRLKALGSLTEKAEGRVLSEMFDMHVHGAAGFTDGKSAVDTAILIKALQYSSQFAGTVMVFPYNKSLYLNGHINESIQSSLTGLKGIPALGEELQIQRDLSIAAYTGGSLHFSCISSAGSLKLISEARQKGIKVTCDIAAHQIAFDDSVVEGFDTNFKVLPPFRTTDDVTAMLQGLVDGTIDAVCSDHTPLDPEEKNVEFDQASFGIIGLQTAFAVVNTQLKKYITTTQIIEKFTSGPASILKLEQPPIEPGISTDLTFFNPEKKWVFTQDDNLSLSSNSPFFGQELVGKALATFVKGRLHKL